MEKILVIIILAIGIVWRLPYFAPTSLNWDEVSLGYNAYSMSKTGADEWGTKLPTIFRAFGDYKLPVYVYMTTPWPLNPRITSIIAGSLTMLISYLLARKLFGKQVGLVTLSLVALSPWTVMLSRLALEANLAILFISLGMLCMVSKKYFWSIIFFGISVWTYNSARIFVPLFVISYWLIYRFKLDKKTLIIGGLLFIPMMVQLLSTIGQARYKKLSLIDDGAIGKINELQATKPGGRLVYNKATYFVATFAKNYISYLSPNFLFIKGGDHYQFSVQNHGLLYLIMFPFFYLGIWTLIKNYKLKIKNLLLLWLLIAPIAGSITRDSPHTLRAIAMLPLPMILSAVGIVSLLKKHYLVIFPIILLFSINYQLLTNNYYKNYSWSWQYGYKEAIQVVKQDYDKYDQIIFTKKYGEPHEFVAFYWPWDPADSAKNKSWDYHDGWYWVNALGKIKFVNDWEMKSYTYQSKTLIIASPDNIPPGKEIKRINFLDGKPAFIIKEL
ncbi:MAG: glycosyltransferase family 39 protein [Candidatus Amesbacteria bacterium]|nr:glycosyltransferase family 39 protein [Candidatus Amesbacteria bacterium]